MLTFSLWHLWRIRGNKAAVACNALDHQCSSMVILSAWVNAPSYLFSDERVGGVWGNRGALVISFKVFQFCWYITLNWGRWKCKLFFSFSSPASAKSGTQAGISFCRYGSAESVPALFPYSSLIRWKFSVCVLPCILENSVFKRCSQKTFLLNVNC